MVDRDDVLPYVVGVVEYHKYDICFANRADKNFVSVAAAVGGTRS